MKKFLVVLLSLGLIVAFGATASAADVKFSGSYYVVGWYADNMKQGDNTPSAAAFWQRFRVQPVFVVAEGLTLTARWDAMEKGWGNANWKGGTDDMNQSRKQAVGTAGSNPNIQENFEWERGYMTFATKIGKFDLGYQSTGKWGTDFNDDEKSRPRIMYTTKVGPMVFVALYDKMFESVYSSATTTTAGVTTSNYAGKVDADNEQYALAAIYNFKGGSAGLLYKFADFRANRPVANNATKAHAFAPYMKATFGPVYIEAEVNYAMGKVARFESPSSSTDVDWNALGGYLKLQTNLGPAYFGTAAMYMPGDDVNDLTKKKSFINASGNASQDLDMALILGNDALQTWRGQANGGANGVIFDSGKNNSLMVNVFGGFNPTPKLNIEMLFLYASLDKAPVVNGTLNANTTKHLGYEIDLTAKYKLYDNLTYMVGGGYLITGDAFKGFGANSANNKVGNDYLLMNRMSLSF